VQTPAPVCCPDWPRRAAGAALLAIALAFAVPGAAVSAMVPDGAWLIDGAAVVQIFDCSGQLCGRIVWLGTARDSTGRLASDNKNPDPAFRQRLLCGLTILQGLKPAGLDQWNSGSLYNPDDGRTYRVSAELRSPDIAVARIYLGVPLFGETRTLLRVPRLRSEGWC
jgi:uncharacterized protein (DUF2147 family)